MQPNKTKIALVLGVLFLGASGASNAVSTSFPITAKTIPDVTIVQVTPLSYGSNMFVTTGNSCLMQATVPGDVSGVMQYDDTAGVVAAAAYGDIAGTGCVDGTGTGTPGVYKISGLAATQVSITISGFSGTSFDFAPNSGCIVTYDNGTGAANSGDTCVAFVPGVLATKNTAGPTVTEESTAVAPGVTVAGDIIFTVGGTVTIGGTAAVDLTPAFAYSEDFTVDVVY